MDDIIVLYSRQRVRSLGFGVVGVRGFGTRTVVHEKSSWFGPQRRLYEKSNRM